MKYVLAMSEEGRLWLKRAGKRKVEVCTAQEACTILRRTRRQFYRYLKDSTLRPLAKILGEWVVEKEAVLRLSANPATLQPIPKSFQLLFPEYEISTLNAGRHKTIVLGKVLENGNLAHVKWILGRYSKKEIVHFLEEDGVRLLSERALRLWTLYFGCQAKKSWRTHSNPWKDRNK